MLCHLSFLLTYPNLCSELVNTLLESNDAYLMPRITNSSEFNLNKFSLVNSDALGILSQA